jgi:hypothetical protein
LRKSLERLRSDLRVQIGAIGLKRVSRGGDFHRIALRAHRKLSIDAHDVILIHDDVRSYKSPKAGLHDFDLVCAGWNGGQVISSYFVGLCRARFVGGGFPDSDRRLRNAGAACVRHIPNHRTKQNLTRPSRVTHHEYNRKRE